MMTPVVSLDVAKGATEGQAFLAKDQPYGPHLAIIHTMASLAEFEKRLHVLTAHAGVPECHVIVGRTLEVAVVPLFRTPNGPVMIREDNRTNREKYDSGKFLSARSNTEFTVAKPVWPMRIARIPPHCYGGNFSINRKS